MRLFEIEKFLLEDDGINPVDLAKNDILDMLTPLNSQGVNSITVSQVIDELKTDPDLQNLNIDRNFVEQAISGLNDVEMQTNSAGVLCLMLSTNDDGTTATPTQQAQNQSKVDDAATRTAVASLK